jgi:hypothetical protein
MADSVDNNLRFYVHETVYLPSKRAFAFLTSLVTDREFVSNLVMLRNDTNFGPRVNLLLANATSNLPLAAGAGEGGPEPETGAWLFSKIGV